MPGILYCPLTPTTHPRADQINRTVCDWFTDRAPGFPTPEQHKGLLASGAAAYTANCGPTADVETMTWVAKLMVGGFALDDWLETLPTVHEALTVTTAMQERLRTPSTRPPSGMPSGAWNLWCDIADGARRLATPEQFTRFCAAYARYYHHIPLEISHQLGQITPSIDAQPFLRLGVGGPFTPGLEIGIGADIPAQEAAQPSFTALCDAVYLLLLWFNDIATYKPDDVYNLLNTLIAERGYTQLDATIEAITLCNRVMVLTLTLHERLAAVHPSPAMTAFLASILNPIANLVTWHTGNPRYADSGHQITDLITHTVPADLQTGPVPIRSIAWWWDLI